MLTSCAERLLREAQVVPQHRGCASSGSAGGVARRSAGGIAETPSPTASRMRRLDRGHERRRARRGSSAR